VFVSLLRAGRNAVVSLRRRGLDYVWVRVRGSYPELSPPSPPFPFRRFYPTEISLSEMRRMAEVLAKDRRVRGVVLFVDGLEAGLATVQSLRESIRWLRDQGKEVVCWLPSMGTAEAYLAAACDRVLLPESASLFAPGLRVEQVFLKETLALVGIEAELEAFSEYKVAPDTFRRASMTDPHREMLNAILDSTFAEVVGGIAEGRKMEPERVQNLMDRMPISAQEAAEAGLIDGVCYEDQLAALLGDENGPASLIPWAEARRWLRRPIRWQRAPQIGVVPVEGTIVTGRSRRLPPLPLPIPLLEQQAGSETVAQALRAAERNRRIAAVILYINSPGGSALASDLIWREVRRLRERKPVVVLMGERAASGGYYIAAPASALVARPTTLTGSIGIWGGKFVVAGLLERLRVGREGLRRGERAGLYSAATPFTPQEREAVRRDIEEGYVRFKRRVAEGRGLSPEQVEEVARGRVWTGQQALERGLVDGLGGFEEALRRAKELAGLPPDVWFPIVRVEPPRAYRLPFPFPSPQEVLGTLREALRALERERLWALAPWEVRIVGA